MTTAGHGTGSLAEEVLRLVEAMGLAGQAAAGCGHVAGDPADGAGHPADGAGSAADGGRPGAGGPPECRVCPLCRFVAGLRQLRPEVVEHLAAAGEELLAAAREFAASSAARSAASSARASAAEAAARTTAEGSGAPSGDARCEPDNAAERAAADEGTVEWLGPSRVAPVVERIELD